MSCDLEHAISVLYVIMHLNLFMTSTPVVTFSVGRLPLE